MSTRKLNTQLIADFNSGNFTREELIKKHGYENRKQNFYSAIYYAKTIGQITREFTDLPKKDKLNVKYTLASRTTKLLADLTANNLSEHQLCAKYEYTLTGLRAVVSRLKNRGLLNKPVIEETVEKEVKPAQKTVKSKPTEHLIGSPVVRTIHFPDGFSIQIEKTFTNGVLIHSNGNVTVLR